MGLLKYEVTLGKETNVHGVCGYILNLDSYIIDVKVLPKIDHLNGEIDRLLFVLNHACNNLELINDIEQNNDLFELDRLMTVYSTDRPFHDELSYFFGYFYLDTLLAKRIRLSVEKMKERVENDTEKLIKEYAENDKKALNKLATQNTVVEQSTKYDTLEELFFSKYDLNDICENPFAIWDAIGFLKGIKYLAPSWCPGSADELLTSLYNLQEHNAYKNREWLKEVFR